MGPEEKKVGSVQVLEKSEPDVVGREDDMPGKGLNGDDTSKVEVVSGCWGVSIKC